MAWVCAGAVSVNRLLIVSGNRREGDTGQVPDCATTGPRAAPQSSALLMLPPTLAMWYVPWHEGLTP